MRCAARALNRPRRTGSCVALEPLKVPSPDKTGAQLFIVILAPEDGADDHLELLRETAELFSDAEARETLLKASTPVEVCEFLTHWETAQTAAH